MAVGGASPPPPGRRGLIVMLGLLATFIGLAALAALDPIAPSGYPGLLGYFAVGVVALWIGGILLGFGLGRRPSRRGAR